MKKNILVPFVGFYESVASDKAENIAFWNFISEKGIQDRDGRLDIPDDLTEAEQTEFWDEFWPKVRTAIHEDIAKDYLHHLGNELDLDLVFESIDSPRYYNYTTDRLFCDAKEDQLISLYNKVDQKILEEMIKENHTSRPGFDSYYSNDINDESWHNPAHYDHNQWLTVIDAYIKQNEINVDDLYWI